MEWSGCSDPVRADEFTAPKGWLALRVRARRPPTGVLGGLAALNLFEIHSLRTWPRICPPTEFGALS